MSPLRCECGRFPSVDKEGPQEFYVMCRVPYCFSKTVSGKTYEEAVGKWNEERNKQAGVKQCSE